MQEAVSKQVGPIALINSRRIRIWGAAMIVIIGAYLLQGAIPSLSWEIPGFSEMSRFTVLAIFFSALICEYVDSALGMGYGTTLTPLLLLCGMEPLQVVPCVLLSEFLTGLSAAMLHHRDGNVDFLRDREAKSTAMWLSLLSVIGTLLAVFLAIRISKTLLTLLIGVIVISMGVITLWCAGRQLKYRRNSIITIGIVAAFNKGLSGGGYGPLVTAGQVVSGLSPRKAVAVTSLAESLVCITGLIAYLAAGKSIGWGLALPLCAGAMMSVPLSTLTVKRVSEIAMRRAVGIASLGLGIFAVSKIFW
ncbi:sulfite exporter TauE/SafE family protein [Candidatus Sumerlaeota bacterium]|nr:sulfite exporter TauE/SafE family protein [Candidatus Sumerlaeota bacterium]